MKLLFENWRKYLNENQEVKVFYVNIEKLLPAEELGHGKPHDCPSERCDQIIQDKMNLVKQGQLEPLEVANQKPVNPHRLDGECQDNKSGVNEPFYHVLNGHHRLEACKKLGIKQVPVFLTTVEFAGGRINDEN